MQEFGQTVTLRLSDTREIDADIVNLVQQESRRCNANFKNEQSNRRISLL